MLDTRCLPLDKTLGGKYYTTVSWLGNRGMTRGKNGKTDGKTGKTGETEKRKEEAPMALVRCNGSPAHYYDSSMHTTCPHCGVPDLDIRETIGRRPAGDFRKENDVKTMPRDQSSPGRGEPGVTVGVMSREIGIDPVVGWFVCVEGPDKGLDYRIHAGNNSIGRSEQMRICIDGDDGISRENHAFIAFDPKEGQFTLLPGTSKELAYLDGKAVFAPTQLRAFQRVQLGKTVLLFVPLCGENFQWS